ncbi:hypothetical protein DFAR_3460033 [Desulfarculales bacterium]
MQSLWRLVRQRVDTDKQPHEVFLEVTADARSVAGCARLKISTNSSGVTSISASIIAT